MPLFQNSVVTKQLQSQDKTKLVSQWNVFATHFHNPAIQENIRSSKEEQYQGEFLIDLFVNVLGYTKNPTPNFTLTTEYKNVKDSKKADGAILINDKVKAVIELKGTNTTDLNKIEVQAFGYKNNQPDCVYVITSNFEKLRFYIDNATEHLEFNLFNLTEKEFELLYLCLAYDNIANDIPKKLKEQSLSKEKDITKALYTDYSQFKSQLHQDLVKQNPGFDALELFKKSQKLLDRFLFLFFAEDRQLLPPNSVRLILNDWRDLQERDEVVPLYSRFKKYFEYLNTGFKGKRYDVFAYNGGLFKPDAVLDNIVIDDELLFIHTAKLSDYDFASEVDVNILGHIFENSLNELDEIKAQLEGGIIDKATTKRKKDGVFYTPKYITKYIVDNTIGKLCIDKKAEIKIIEEDYFTDKKRTKVTKQPLLEKLTTYRNWLLQITICDPACGSGAFLNQALDFLIQEHQYIDELETKITGGGFVFPNVEKSILENNLFGVDLNEESVEIAKLSLWLRTAQPNRKLNDLNNNIKCGNSLISDVVIAGEKAFNWQTAFPKIFDKGGFDVIIGNPPYGATLKSTDVKYFRDVYSTVIGHSEVYYIFTEKAIKTLIKENGYLGFIIPNAWLSNKYAKKLRELLIDETKIEKLINFNKKIIFEDANVETAIVISKINPTIDNVALVGQDLDLLYEFKQNEWKSNNDYLISFASDNTIDKILKKINLSEFKLSDKLDISNGFKPYQVGYGINQNGEPLKDEDVKNRIYHSNTNENQLFKNEIKGKGVNRYSLKWEESYINWGSWLMSPKSSHYFEQPKILVRQVISDYLFAYLDKEKYFADQSLYVCTNYRNKEEESLEFYQCLLNSKLYGFYFRKFYSEEDDLFPKIKVNELKNIPVKDISKEKQQPFIEKADLMLSLNKELQEQSQKFQRNLQREFQLETLPKKLQDWYLLPYNDFVKELEKQKVKLSLSQKAEWEDYFTTEATKLNTIKNQIKTTDKAIDTMVYELYGLSKEEIKIVEES
ncbi:TaqI-like C-terminal specificity domain-containing protein [Flavobacterium sp.]|uniref:Eco57I restriction-modification methylase domain-containing protein n=1 Tax=Flavobacterium sp. TaxID=239 RepID=UPI0026002EDA|nr:TaqI-like C-terminal specificity domain-containing protein [Flavobacterium sp.]